MSFFLSADISLGNKVLEIVYIVSGFMVIYTGLKNLRDPENKNPIGTCVFWCSLGVVVAFGRWLPSLLDGILVIVMCVPAIFGKVSKGRISAPTAKETQAAYEHIGMKIFIPALVIGVAAIICAVVTVLNLSATSGIGIGVLLSAIILMVYSKKNTPMVFLNDSERLLSTVGPLSMLPQLLACLGAIFTAAGVGDVVAALVTNIIPQGNVNIGIIVYAFGMMLFTMIMGNAFAAITVMTVGIGYPFVLAYGANPVVIGMLALTCGYCGTLCTPMAANFNIVPVALLDMKNRWTVIRNQVPIALFMIIFQICVMIALK